MHTRKKHRYIQDFVDVHASQWFKEYGGDLVGVHVGKKRVGKKQIQRYSIVFHVVRKKDNPEIEIPRSFEIETPTGDIIIAKTDVLETGGARMEMGMFLSENIRSLVAYNPGAIGAYLTRGNEIYALSNMHVIGYHLLHLGSVYIPVENQMNIDVQLYNGGSEWIGAYLEEGYYMDSDIAIARIDNPYSIVNEIPGYGVPKGYKSTWDLKSYYPLIMGAVSGLKDGTVESIGAHLSFMWNGVRLERSNLIAMHKYHQRITLPGDSGSPVFVHTHNAGQLLLVGIVMGSDNYFTYVIGFKEIFEKFYDTQLLTT